MPDIDSTSNATEQAPRTAHDLSSNAAPGNQAGEREAASISSQASQLLERNPWLAHVSVLLRLCLLAGLGVTLRLLVTPTTVLAVTAGALVTAGLAVGVYRGTGPYARRRSQPADDAWRLGETPAADVPVATIEAVTPVFAQLPSKLRGAWLEVAPCSGERHDLCERGYTLPVGDGMCLVVVGAHIIERPADTAFVVAHEVQHLAGWTYHLSCIACAARQAGWFIVGWAIAWPWLLVGLAAIQVAHAVACWLTEIGCDFSGVRITGREGALSFFAYQQSIKRRPTPDSVLSKCARRLLILVAVPTAHPPFWLRIVLIRAFTFGHVQT